jgi:hypothetical protein
MYAINQEVSTRMKGAKLKWPVRPAQVHHLQGHLHLADTANTSAAEARKAHYDVDSF